MGVKFVLGMLLLVATCCHLTSEDCVPSEVTATLRENVQKALNNLKGFGTQSASLSLIKFYLSNINKCLDDVFAFRKADQEANRPNNADNDDELIVIANKELESLTEDSNTMDLDFLVTTSPKSPIRQILLGVYKVNLANLDALSKNPESVITTLAQSDAFQAAKNIFLYTPQTNRILC